jgi:hypothetical protein
MSKLYVCTTTDLRQKWKNLTVAVADEGKALVVWTRGDKVFVIKEASAEEASQARVELKKQQVS